MLKMYGMANAKEKWNEIYLRACINRSPVDW
jgi:hypothetical protein